ncbi:uncharacterized protein K452DRAFT_313332 [Aplosporella prunicola CBS 121167]|uniref:Uncharacterized protein n=1 Tax=Aplosporella prunicola CBS 121167 TaxID=1176127 RepID=A0A6A6AYB7_9PEZI|nr:uncharacterized protein K452DRAFT_313332 [Aplosporella prunicola CBS 121167]KAF2136248.1 hypothetical protein K452DRAFT_313332 [Aplosporella prunicola CBS 121167]
MSHLVIYVDSDEEGEIHSREPTPTDTGESQRLATTAPLITGEDSDDKPVNTGNSYRPVHPSTTRPTGYVSIALFKRQYDTLTFVRYWKGRCLRCEKFIANLESGHSIKNCRGKCWICKTVGMPVLADFSHFGKRCFGPWRDDEFQEITGVPPMPFEFFQRRAKMEVDDAPPPNAPWANLPPQDQGYQNNRNPQKRMEDAIRRRDEEIKDLKQEIASLKRKNKLMDNAIKFKNNKLKVKNEALKHRDDEIRFMNEELRLKDEKIKLKDEEMKIERDRAVKLLPHAVAYPSMLPPPSAPAAYYAAPQYGAGQHHLDHPLPGKPYTGQRSTRGTRSRSPQRGGPKYRQRDN